MRTRDYGGEQALFPVSPAFIVNIFYIVLYIMSTKSRSEVT